MKAELLKTSSNMWMVGGLFAIFVLLPPNINMNVVVVDAANLPEEVSAANRQDAKQRFLDEYSKAYDKLSSPFRNIVAKGHVKEEHADIPDYVQGKVPFDNDHVPWENAAQFAKVVCDGDFTYYFEGRSIQYEMLNAAYTLDKHPATVVRCTTPSYFFALERETGRKDYVIRQNTSEKETLEKTQMYTIVFAEVYAEAAFAMYSLHGNLLLSKKDCKIDSVRYVDEADRKLVAIEFTGLSDSFWYKRGCAVFDPSQSWAITEFELHEDFTKPYGRTTYCKIEYGDWKSNGLVFPKKVDRKMVYTTSGKATHLRHEVATFTAAEPGAVPKGQFALSAYGLPNVSPKGLQSRPNIPPSGLILDASASDIGPVSPGEQRTVRFLFRNQTAKPIRIIGAEQTCGNGCNELPGLPVEIAPRSGAEVEVLFTPPSVEGDFCKQFTVFSDYFDRPHIDLTIRGTVHEQTPGKTVKSPSSSH